MKAIKAVAFDLEGPLVDFEQFHFGAHCEATEKVLGCSVNYGWIIENVPHAIGGGDEVIATGIARHYGSGSPAQIQDLLKHKRMLFAEMVSSNTIIPRAGVLSVIEWLVKNNYHITVGSNTPKSEAIRYLNEIGALEYFNEEYVVLVEHVGGKKKPLPDIYIETANRVSVDPRHQLVIDDSPAGLEAASAAGSPSIATPLHRSHGTMGDVVRWSPRRIIHDWREIDFPTMMDGLEEELKT